ncbi:beta-N-acetylhexosaminidase [Microbacterium sp. gxy059]|uniref:beta-N-acetylhexosaminidase n=1 Tax=Microbacterium sp. gxy059 TaxID=2957199 RepID=UPI003D96C926
MALPLLPLPQSIDERDGALALGSGLAVDADDALRAEADLLARDLAERIGSGPAADAPTLTLRLGGDHGEEGYALAVDETGIAIEASAPAGAFWAGRTLLQLVEGAGSAARVPAVEVRDAPRFAYRGVMLDIARHFHPVETIVRLIRQASDLKKNVLHLHLTDDQGWRIRLDSRPELAEAASGSSVWGDPGGFLTRDDYATIVRAAAERHMTVVPEVDVPGHTHAVGLAYPELAADPVISDAVREVAEIYGGGLPVAGEPYHGLGVGFSSLVADAPGVDDFLRDVFGELAEMTPGPYLHLGGDEALGTPPDVYREFTARAARIVAETGKTPIAWHEAGAASTPEGAIGQYWGLLEPTDGADEKARAFVARGGRVILSPADAIYLDMKYDADQAVGLTWANGPTSVERSYRWDPAGVIEGLDERDVLGVESALWTETVRTRDDIDHQVLPRLASGAEAGWSAPLGSTPERTWEGFRSRVAGLAGEWERQGARFFRSPEIPWR